MCVSGDISYFKIPLNISQVILVYTNCSIQFNSERDRKKKGKRGAGKTAGILNNRKNVRLIRDAAFHLNSAFSMVEKHNPEHNAARFIFPIHSHTSRAQERRREWNTWKYISYAVNRVGELCSRDCSQERQRETLTYILDDDPFSEIRAGTYMYSKRHSGVNLTPVKLLTMPRALYA